MEKYRCWILILLLILTIKSTTVTENYTHITVENIEILQTPELTKQNVIKFIKQLPLQHADILYQKIILETGHLTSQLATNYNNLTGMRVVKKRITTQSGIAIKGYGKYDDWRDSILDYLLWQQSVVKKKLSKSEYYDFTAKIYSVRKNEYVKTLKQIRLPYEMRNM